VTTDQPDRPTTDPAETDQPAPDQPDPAGTGAASNAAVSSGTAGLQRTLGLRAALGIGMGTMIGAGIFVFPGLAGGEAGPAASLSFALGGVIALLVALPASELATAMPRSGGGYVFVSRGLGTRWGSLVGFGQWVGLVFASAFYLSAAGDYLLDSAERLGMTVPFEGAWVGFTLAVILSGISLVGTRNTGRLQNGILAVLGLLLIAFLAWAGLALADVVPGPPTVDQSFFSEGGAPVFTAAALVFTSYLGFAQIAAVAGEIREPERNVPRAMVGSVLLVMAAYVATMLVATSWLSVDRMAELGETAMIEVARLLAGPLGVIGFLACGMLATLSSANASILSSSRSMFALGRDGLVPDGVGAVNERFRTPHVALLLAGGPIAILTLVGPLDVLAEVASLLHLVLYGLMCFSLIAFRRRDPETYRPTFTCPGYPWVPILGGVASLSLILLMNPLSQVIGGAVLLVALAWTGIYAPDVRLKETP